MSSNSNTSSPTGQSFVAGLVSGLAGTGRGLWPYRRELAPFALAGLVWWPLHHVLDPAVAAGVALIAVVAPLAVPVVRRAVWGWLRCGRARRQLTAGFRATKVVNADGRTPRIRRVSPTPVGEHAVVEALPGHSAELMDLRMWELRAACKARTVLIDRDPNRSDLVSLDIIRRDPFVRGGHIPWRDQDAEQLSMWDLIHFGVSDTGAPVMLPLAGAHLLLAGGTGSGKSAAITTITAHAAKSPDAHLLLIDPNMVQLSPWRHRALAYADDNVADAIGLLRVVQDEILRRGRLLVAQPGVVRKVSPELMTALGLTWWVLVIDELAYHTSVAGNSKTQAEFAMLARDIVARGRAVGIAAVMGTQRPTQDVVPRSLADLFPLRAAFKVNTMANSDVILGDGWARKGFNAAEIDQATPGVGLLLAEGGKPVRFKGCWIADEVIDDLSVSTIPLRPAPPAAAAASTGAAPAASTRTAAATTEAGGWIRGPGPSGTLTSVPALPAGGAA